MFTDKMSRRQMIRKSGLAIVGTSLAGLSSCVSKMNDQPKTNSKDRKKRPFRVSLNTSTIRGYKLPVEEQISLCAAAGFEGIELWVNDVETYLEQGGSPERLAEIIKSNNLILENMIAFSTWIADDSIQRKEGIQKMRKDMELTARLGGKFIAAPVQGIRSIEKEKLPDYANRYLEILRMGDEEGVTPILELWGAGALNQLSDTAAISIGTAHPKATMLLDFYHLYRGGNSFDSLYQINGRILPVFHINDYPASPDRKTLIDGDRVFPGDGICPFNKVLPILHEIGFRGGFSIELFNQSYWNTMDVKTLLKKSYEKTVEVIDNSISI